MHILIIVIVLLILLCHTQNEYMEGDADIYGVKYYLAGNEVVLNKNPASYDFTRVTSDTNKIFIPNHMSLINKSLYKETPDSDLYNKYIKGMTALNDEIGNRYKNNKIKESQEYCYISRAREIPLLSTNINSKRLDQYMVNENKYD